MKSFYSLFTELNNLPKGNIYIKKIKGIEYSYWQYFDNGQKKIKLVKGEELEELKKAIERRKKVEEKVREYLKSGNRNLFLSNNARNLTGYVMNENMPVAEYENGNLVMIDDEHAPLIIKRTHSLNAFLRTRVIDTSRTNTRLLKKVMNIKEDEEEMISLCSYAASISDSYWFKPKHSKLNYEDVTFSNDIFFDLALRGLVTIFPRKIVLTPELTTPGSYEKGWKNENGKWFLYKVGTPNEIFSELFYSRLLERLNVPTAHYEYEEGFIKTENFASDVNFEPMVALVGLDEDYDYVLNELLNVSSEIAKDYLILLYYDAILNNVDRHNENNGILRDKKSGKILSLAPNFDDNLSLISRTIELNCSTSEGFLQYFAKFLRSNKVAKEILKSAHLKEITEDTLNEIFKEIPIKVDEELIKKFVLTRYEYLTEVINK